MLRKSVPMRGPFRSGDLVSFLRRGTRYGPARTTEGRGSLRRIHAGVTVLVAETSCRPATSEEVAKKYALELRPSARGRRVRHSF